MRDYTEKTQDEMTTLSFSELLDKVKQTKAKLTEIIPKFPKFNFPKTSKLKFLDYLWRNIGLLKYNPASTALVKHHIEEIQTHLKSLMSFFEDVSELDIEEHPELEDLVDLVTDSAYKVQYVMIELR